MKTTIRSLVCALALTAFSAQSGQADEPTQLSKGKVALLESDRIMEGDIERVGDQYRIRRAIGETWLPADKIVHLCANLEEAHAYLRSQTNLNDPDERLRLARWCLLHNLRTQALAEATAAVELRPNHVESQRLARGLQRAEASAALPAGPKNESEHEAGPVANLPYNPEALGPFVMRVQPILMNTCACCHANGKGAAFKLIRGHDEGMLTNRKTTQQNLMATLALLTRDQPQASPLLSYALTIHGDADKPPLKGRTVPAYRILEDWVQLAVANTPTPASLTSGRNSGAESKTIREVNPKPSAVGPAAPEPATPAGTQIDSGSWIPRSAPVAVKEGINPVAPVATKPACKEEFAQPAKPDEEPPATSPATATEPADPFDPVIFNRQMQPQK